MRYVILALATLLVSGCASTPQGGADTKPGKAGPNGVTMHPDQDLDWAWSAPDLNWVAYDTVYLSEPRADVKDLTPDDAESLEWARGLLREKFVPVLRESKLFKIVITRESEIPDGAKVLRLETVITEYSKGSTAARVFVGVVGHPLIAIQGSMRDGERQIFAFEERRGGTGVRMFGAYRPNRDLQQADLTDIADLLVDHIGRASGRKR